MADHEEVSDKLAGHAPARKAGGMRLPATKNKPVAEKVDDNEPSVPVANLGGLGGTENFKEKSWNKVKKVKIFWNSSIQPVMVKEQDVVEEVAKEKSEQVHVKMPSKNVPKVQQSHKPVQHTINQPR